VVNAQVAGRRTQAAGLSDGAYQAQVRQLKESLRQQSQTSKSGILSASFLRKLQALLSFLPGVFAIHENNIARST
jgi:hypothetical protein